MFEGSIKYEKAFYGLKIWNNDNYSLYDYISENSVAPKFTMTDQHQKIIDQQ